MARRKLESNPLPGLPQSLPRKHSATQSKSHPQPSHSLPGGYAPPAREKSKSKHSGHAKSASTGTLPTQVVSVSSSVVSTRSSLCTARSFQIVPRQR
ncbi:hypothetical protein AG1IA_10244 [Rhizoctonia solani AG-1 IA]|uniref:Uncharacterized protein n=1 Tax=Thanatephorus cucumeris (strain AG1-IA) TaxID=983506 RepID=L8WC23_THACA|nr:hypothetical protein AG1IA_10244 [Rhizoctonia solani AG-1 IA]